MVLHWSGALMVVLMLITGWMMTGDLLSLYSRGQYAIFHKSLGIVLLFVTAGRWIWNARRPMPPVLLKGLRPWEIALGDAMKKVLLILVLATALTGWSAHSASPRLTPFFGLFPIPKLFFIPAYENNENLHHLLGKIHEALATLLALAVLAHIGTAAKAHFLLKNGALIRIVPPAVRPFLMRLRGK
jgi:cytochrome b561